MNWDNERVLAFIKEFEKRPTLWKKEMHGNTAKKDEAWRELSEIFGEDTNTLRRKMESLRGSRRREKTRARRTAREGKAYVSKWFAWESMKFLDDMDEPHSQNSGSDNEEADFDTPGDIGHILTIKCQDEDSPQNNSLMAAAVAHSERVGADTRRIRPSSKRQRKYVDDEDPLATNDYSCNYTVARPELDPGEKDECALFADFIAEKLRKFGRRERATLQRDILNLVVQVEVDLNDY